MVKSIKMTFTQCGITTCVFAEQAIIIRAV